MRAGANYDASARAQDRAGDGNARPGAGRVWSPRQFAAGHGQARSDGGGERPWILVVGSGEQREIRRAGGCSVLLAGGRCARHSSDSGGEGRVGLGLVR